MIEKMPGIQTHGVSGAGSMFLLPAQPAPREPPLGPALAATVRDAGRYMLEFDLGEPRPLSGIDVSAPRRYDDLAARMRIETSDDGQRGRSHGSAGPGGFASKRRWPIPQLAPMRIRSPATRALHPRLPRVGVDEGGDVTTAMRVSFEPSARADFEP